MGWACAQGQLSNRAGTLPFPNIRREHTGAEYLRPWNRPAIAIQDHKIGILSGVRL